MVHTPGGEGPLAVLFRSTRLGFVRFGRDRSHGKPGKKSTAWALRGVLMSFSGRWRALANCQRHGVGGFIAQFTIISALMSWFAATSVSGAKNRAVQQPAPCSRPHLAHLPRHSSALRSISVATPSDKGHSNYARGARGQRGNSRLCLA